MFASCPPATGLRRSAAIQVRPSRPVRGKWVVIGIFVLGGLFAVGLRWAVEDAVRQIDEVESAEGAAKTEKSDEKARRGGAGAEPRK